MIKLKNLFAVVLCSLFFSAVQAEQNISVFVDAGEEIGQALLVKHAGACQAIVPTHVVEKSSFISLFGRGNRPPLGDALGVANFGYDLSVMQIDGELALECGPLFDGISRNVESLLNEDPRAQVNTVNPDGTVSRFPLTIMDQSLTYIFVAPTYTEYKLMKGMSGSLVTVSGKPLGMLLSVNGESGIGKVIRIDRLLETVTPYFRSDKVVSAGALVKSEQQELLGDNLISAIDQWSAPAVSGEYRAQNLLVTNNEQVGPWIAKIQRMPESIIFSLGENSHKPLDTLVISGAGLEGDKRLAKQVEIMIDSVGNNRWRSLQVITLSNAGEGVRVPLVGRKAKKIMLRIHNNWGNVSEVALGRVFIAGLE